VTFPYDEWRCEEALWYCLRHKKDEHLPKNREHGTTKNEEDSGESNAPIVVEQSEGVPQAITPEEERKYRKRYLGSQWALVGVAVGGIVIAINSLCSLNKSVRAANRQAAAASTQARTAQQEFELSERPWLKVTAAPISSLIFDKDGAHLTVQFQLSNHGKSPASGVWIQGQFICPQNSFDALIVQKTECTGRSNAQSGPSGNYTRLGYPIFPDDPPFIQNMSFQLNRSDIEATEKAFSNLSGHPTQLIAPQIVGCVVYNLGGLAYDTDFRYEIFGFHANQPNADFMVTLQTIPLNEFTFSTSIIGNEAH
jgi:hypothetical protein